MNDIYSCFIDVWETVKSVALSGWGDILHCFSLRQNFRDFRNTINLDFASVYSIPSEWKNCRHHLSRVIIPIKFYTRDDRANQFLTKKYIFALSLKSSCPHSDCREPTSYHLTPLSIQQYYHHSFPNSLCTCLNNDFESKK